MPPHFLGHQWSGDTPGARLRQARIARNMTIRDLAEAIGISVTSISHLEKDKASASFETLRRLSKVLKVPISFLGCFESLPETTLGERIHKARLFHGLTKKEFAKVIGVDVATLRKWEQGKHTPLQEHLVALALYLAILDNSQGKA